MADIVAFIETRAGQIRRISHEALTAARTLADATGSEVHALVLGGPAVQDTASLASYGADRIAVAENDVLANYSGDGYAALAADYIRRTGARLAIFGGSALGKDLAPRVAARLGTGYAADCTELEVDADTVIATRPRYAGKVTAREAFESAPAVVTIRPNVFSPVEQPGAGKVETINAQLDAADLAAVVKEIRAAAGKKVDVAEASVVVAGGRGLRDPDNFKLLEELAEALGGAVGASRAVVDAGWRPHSEQVGQTGKTVAPQLYFAIGISGAIQHLAGMRTSRYIVAINKDPDAPIFKMADYGIVGDLFEIVPRLTEEIRKLKEAA